MTCLRVSWLWSSAKWLWLSLIKKFLKNIDGCSPRLPFQICETLESVTVLGLVLSLGWKMQMRSRKPSNSPDLGWYSLWRHGHSTVLTKWYAFLFLSWPLDEPGWLMWPDSFCYLVSRVASSAKAYLLAIENISSDVLGFFMVSLRIRRSPRVPSWRTWQLTCHQPPG
jgi:hypothetical protein